MTVTDKTPLVFTPEEETYLLDRLESAIKETRVEARHTRIAKYREKVLGERELIQGIVAKLRGEIPSSE